MPLHQLMGSYRRSLPAYALVRSCRRAEAYAEEAASFHATWLDHLQGAPADAMGRGTSGICEAVRKAVGDDHRLMLDSTWAYQYTGGVAGRAGDRGARLLLVEDPLFEDDLADYIKLKAKLSIPIMATEYHPVGYTAFAPWLTAQATDFLRGDVAVKGGLTASRRPTSPNSFHMNFEFITAAIR